MFMNDEATYEFFKKELDNTTLRIESVKGIAEARIRIAELNRMEPDQYFISIRPRRV